MDERSVELPPTGITRTEDTPTRVTFRSSVDGRDRVRTNLVRSRAIDRVVSRRRIRGTIVQTESVACQ
ncbi:hypothetical protein D8S78_08640 [Natrialba swarupiae]|nr:hypothetical protein [Natrialba swarupiae]